MIYPILAILLSLAFQQNEMEALLNRRVSVELNKATVFEVVEALRTQHAIPLSFIQSTRYFNKKEEINIKVSSGTVRDALEKIKSYAPDYNYGFVEGHLVLYSNEPKYQKVVDSLSIRDTAGFNATYSYLDVLRARWPEYKELMSPVIKGDPRAAFFTDRVSIRTGGTVLKGFAQLLGNNRSVVFTIIYWEKASRPMFYFDNVK